MSTMGIRVFFGKDCSDKMVGKTVVVFLALAVNPRGNVMKNLLLHNLLSFLDSLLE